jgi:hypothetical protein
VAPAPGAAVGQWLAVADTASKDGGRQHHADA